MSDSERPASPDGRPASGEHRGDDATSSEQRPDDATSSEQRPDDATSSEQRPDDAPVDLREAEVAFGESDFEAMGIEGLLGLYREAGIRDFEELACQGDGAIVRVVVDQAVDVAALSGLDCVDRWTHVGVADGDHEYVVEFTAPGLPECLAEEFDDLVGSCDPEIDERGGTVSMVGTQETIASAVTGYRGAGVSPDLRRLGRYDGRSDPLDALTDRQRDVMRTAYDLGHYEVPSEASTADVAAELDLDPSTVAEHLQRAERNLLRQHLE
jgi:DNA-binding CsgD family transcriptional regulator